MRLRQSPAAPHCLGRRPASSAQPAAPAGRCFRLVLIWLSLTFLCCVPWANAATIRIPADQPTIQAGINAAANGDTVLVSPGTYYENIDFKGKAITVTSSAGPATTIIHGDGTAPAVTFKTAEPRAAVLSNLTIQYGGNFSYMAGSQYVFEAGGIAVQQSSPTIINNTITLNNCWDIRIDAGAPLIQGNEISATQDPHGQCSFGGGAAIYVGGNLGNTAGPGSSPFIVGNTIENNVESGLETAGGNGGAGIAIWAGSPIIENNIIRNNSSPGGSGGAINVEGSSGTIIIQNLIYGNSAGCGGGAIAFNTGYVSPPGFDVLVANNTIVNNTSQSNAGYTECTTISQFYPSPDTYGEARFTAVFVNNIVSGSTAYPAVNCSWFTHPPVEWQQPIFDHNILYNAGGAFFGSFCIDVSAKYGNIVANPQFVDAANGNFQLAAGSPALDTGNNSVLQSIATLTGSSLSRDFANNARVQDATGKGYPIVDMGAYEFGGVVDANPTTVVLTSSAYFGSAGSNYTLTANFASALGVPTGTASFFLNGQLIGASTINNSGIATFSNFLMPPGTNNLYVSYAGQGAFTPATSVIIIVDINLYSTTLTLTSSANPAIIGQPVTFTVTASSDDTTSIPSPIKLTDTSTNTTLATLIPNSAGVATYTTSSLALGNHLLSAAYAGDSTHNAASALLSQRIISGLSTSANLTSSLNPAPYNQSVTLTATVTNASTTGAPTGTITFSDGATVLGTQPLTASGATTATTAFSTSNLSVGTHTITATYTASGSFSSSTATLTQTITGLSTTTALTSSANPSNAGLSITFTATITNTSTTSGAPTGTLTFSDGPTVLATQTVTANTATTATASFSTSTLAAGTHTITATYTPTGAFSSSTAPLTQVINALASITTLTAAPNPANFGQTVTLVAGVGPVIISGLSPIPTGTITFFDGATQLASAPILTGQATITTSTLAVGTHTLTAVYSGNAIYSASTSLPFAETIKALPQDFTITLAQPTITIQTQHHTTTSLTLASLNGFTDSIALGCVNPPTYVTCRFTPASTPLAANGTATVSLYLDTDSVLGYAHLQSPPPVTRTTPSPISLAVLLSPFGFFGILTARATRRRNNLTYLRLFLLLLIAISTTVALTGCGEIIYPFAIPPSATPGTYTLQIVASGAATGVTHTTNLTLQITP